MVFVPSGWHHQVHNLVRWAQAAQSSAHRVPVHLPRKAAGHPVLWMRLQGSQPLAPHPAPFLPKECAPQTLAVLMLLELGAALPGSIS